MQIDKFRQQILNCGLCTKDELAGFEAQLPQQPETTQDLAKELVRAGRLTKFQAQSLYNGKGASLVLGNYFILDKLGAGGMGQVFRAEHRRMKRVVALKVLPAEMVKDSTNVQRFHREVQAAARLNHPNIVTAYDADETKGVHYYVMENVDGDDLSSLVRRDGTLTAHRAIEIITQAARGLQYAHQHGVIHRDIKPSNILLDRQGVVKILDMGLARFDDGADVQAQAALTHTGTVMGTIDYMSPEQALDTKHADARSDLYSLGCTLWFLMTGQPVYAGDTLMKKLLAHRETAIPSLQRHPKVAAHTDCSPQLLARLDGILQKMLAKNPDERYRSMEEVIAALQSCAVTADSPTVAIAAGQDDSDSIPNFFPDEGDSSSPTLVSMAPVDPATMPAETLPSGFLDHTMSSGLSRFRRKPRTTPVSRALLLIQQRKKTAIGIGAVLATLCAILPLLLSRPDETQTEQPVTTAPPPALPPETINLFSQIDPASHTESGTWVTTPDRGLRIDEPASPARLSIPFRPTGSYEWTVSFTRLSGNNSAVLYFPIGERSCSLALGWWDRVAYETKASLSSPRNGDAGEFLRMITPSGIETDQRNTLAIRVDRTGAGVEITVRLNGLPYMHWEGSLDQLGTALPAHTPRDPTTLALLAYDSVYEFHSATLRSLSPASSDTIRIPDSPGHFFNGDGDYVQVPSLPYDDPEEGVTLEAWVRPHSSNDSANVFSWMGPRWVSLFQDADKWGVGKRQDDGQALLRTSVMPLAVNEWTHLAAVIQGWDLQLFVDGEPQAVTPSSFPLDLTDGGLYIGGAPEEALKHPEHGVRWFHGDIRSVRISRGLRYGDSSFQPATNLTSDDDTLALYRFDELDGATVRDLSGNAHDGTLYDGTPAAGPQNGALLFDSPDDRVTCEPLPIIAGEPLTIEARIQFDELPPGWEFLRIGGLAVGAIREGRIAASVSPGAAHYYFLPSDEPLPAGSHHIAVVYDGATLVLFIDGRRQQSPLQRHDVIAANDVTVSNVGDARIDPPYAGQSLVWGSSTTPVESVHCLLDEVRVSNIPRYAADFDPNARHAPDQHTLALYHCDEPAGDTLLDSSSREANGVIAGAVRTPPASATPPAARGDDRAAAEWVLSLGGTVQCRRADGSTPVVSNLAALPSEHFQTVSIDLAGCVALTEESLGALEGLHHLHTLNLSETNLDDSLLASIAPLSSVTHLYLHYIRVTDAIWPVLAQWRGLRVLHAPANNFTGVGIEALSVLPDLYEVNLYDCGHLTPTALAECSRLPHLRNLYLTNSVSDPAVLAELADAPIEVFSIDMDSFTDEAVQSLARLPALFHLSLYAETGEPLPLTRVLEFVNARRLTNLSLAGAGFHDASVTPLGEAETLTAIHLINCPNISDAALQQLQSRLPDCRFSRDGEYVHTADRTAAEWVLSVGGQIKCVVNEQTLSVDSEDQLPAESFQLTEVTLSKCPLTAEGLHTLRRLKHLRNLLIDGPSLTDDLLADIPPIRSVSRLALIETSLTDASWPVLARWTGVEWLTVPLNQFTGEGIGVLAALPRLTGLDFSSWPRISAAGAAEIAGLSQVEQLNIVGSITDPRTLAPLKDTSAIQLTVGSFELNEDFVAALADFPALQQLYVTTTPQSRPSIEPVLQLAERGRLRVIDLSGPGWTDEMMASIQSVAGLQVLSFSSCPNISESALQALQARLTGVQVLRDSHLVR